MNRKIVNRIHRRTPQSPEDRKRLREIREKVREEFPPRDPPRLRPVTEGIGAKFAWRRQRPRGLHGTPWRSEPEFQTQTRSATSNMAATPSSPACRRLPKHSGCDWNWWPFECRGWLRFSNCGGEAALCSGKGVSSLVCLTVCSQLASGPSSGGCRLTANRRSRRNSCAVQRLVRASAQPGIVLCLYVQPT